MYQYCDFFSNTMEKHFMLVQCHDIVCDGETSDFQVPPDLTAVHEVRQSIETWDESHDIACNVYTGTVYKIQFYTNLSNHTYA